MLLDWLISPETNFLCYLTLLLRFAVAEWGDFVTRVCGASTSLPHDSKSPPLKREDEGEGDENEEPDGEEIVLSDEETERFGRVMTCLADLVSSVRGLEKNGLLPYDLSPLLKRLDQVMELYEQCEEDVDRSDVAIEQSEEDD